MLCQNYFKNIINIYIEVDIGNLEYSGGYHQKIQIFEKPQVRHFKIYTINNNNYNFNLWFIWVLFLNIMYFEDFFYIRAF